MLQTWQHQELCIEVTVGSHWPHSLMLCQLHSKQLWSWDLGLVIALHKIFKFEKNPKQYPKLPKTPITLQNISREQYFPFCWADSLALQPMVQQFPCWAPMLLGQPWLQELVQNRSFLSLVQRPLASSTARWAYANLQAVFLVFPELVVQLRLVLGVLLFCTPSPAGWHASTSRISKKI